MILTEHPWHPWWTNGGLTMWVWFGLNCWNTNPCRTQQMLWRWGVNTSPAHRMWCNSQRFINNDRVNGKLRKVSVFLSHMTEHRTRVTFRPQKLWIITIYVKLWASRDFPLNRLQTNSLWLRVLKAPFCTNVDSPETHITVFKRTPVKWFFFS